MRFDDARVGMKVEDSWWPFDHKYVGKIIKKTKTTIRIRNLLGDIVTYDKGHVQFLNKFVSPSKIPVPYFVLVKCGICKSTGKIKNAEGHPAVCPYCYGKGKRKENRPHPSHKMTKWKTEIRCPADTPRFYGVRNCKICDKEELKHPAGHFLNGLGHGCKG